MEPSEGGGYRKIAEALSVQPVTIIDPLPSHIQVTYPDAAGIVWQTGSSHTITWTTTGDPIPNVKIVLQKGYNQYFAVTPSTPNTGSFTYTVPQGQALGSDYLVGVMSTNETIYDYSDALFTIAAGQAMLVNIDAHKDAFYQTLTGPNDGYLQIRSYAWNDNGKPANDADLSAKVWAVWDDQWFYLYEEVKDDALSGSNANTWADDGIEFKFDPQPTDIATNSIWSTGLTALGMGSPGVVAEDNLNSVPDAQKLWARATITGGYALELAIQWPAVTSGSETITPAVGNVFGLAINQHDNDGAGRDATIQWAAVLLDAVWNTPKYCGTVKFLSNHELQFIAKNNMTGVTNPVPYDGSDYTRTGVEEAAVVPSTFSLGQNFPNPFNPSTAFSFNVARPGKIQLEIFDLLGRRIRVLLNETVSPGTHEVRWDGMDESGKSAGSGIYIYKVSDGSRSVSKKMLKVQ